MCYCVCVSFNAYVNVHASACICMCACVCVRLCVREANTASLKSGCTPFPWRHRTVNPESVIAPVCPWGRFSVLAKIDRARAPTDTHSLSYTLCRLEVTWMEGELRIFWTKENKKRKNWKYKTKSCLKIWWKCACNQIFTCWYTCTCLQKGLCIY